MVSLLCLLVSASQNEEQEGGGHDGHAHQHGAGHVFVFGVVLEGGGDQLHQRYVHHHAADAAEEGPVCGFAHVVAVEHKVAHKTTNGLRDAACERPPEPLPPRSGGVVDRHGHAHALGNVMQGDSEGDGAAHGGVREGGHEGGEALGEVVQPDGQPSQQAHLL
eukprot:6894469-Pyramimonas_sp.AAC.1